MRQDSESKKLEEKKQKKNRSLFIRISVSNKKFSITLMAVYQMTVSYIIESFKTEMP